MALDTIVRVEAEDGNPRARAPSVDVLDRLAAALQVPVAALVDDGGAVDARTHARALLGAAPMPDALRALADVAEDGVPTIVRK